MPPFQSTHAPRGATRYGPPWAGLVFAPGRMSAAGLALLTLPLIACQNSPIGHAGGASGTYSSWVCADEGRRPGTGDAPCDEERRFVKGTCDEVRCDAGPLAPNCCPGMYCTPGGTCTVPPSRIRACQSDLDCGEGMFCLDRPRISTSTRTCGFLPVDTAGGCPLGGAPFNERCVNRVPCGGGCPPGAVCNIDTNMCEAAPSTPNDDSGCDQTCSSTELLVYADPDTMLFDMCCEVRCMCATLPPVPNGVWGRFSDIALVGDSIAVSAYDTTYGDLVSARLNRSLGTVQELHYIDGIPSEGDIVGDPAGSRAGRSAPGPDVGKYTSIAVAPDGTVRIAYYDIDNKDLKLATQSDTGAWQVSVVDADADEPNDDDDDGDVGRFASLVIDESGISHITYFGLLVTSDGREVTGPVYARANTQNPTGPSDWTRTMVESVRTCNGDCLPNEACVLLGGEPTCARIVEDHPACDACACDEACVDDGGPTCRTEQVNRLTEPCDAACPSGTQCVRNTPGHFNECLEERSYKRSLCAWAGSPCSASEFCVMGSDGPTCAPSLEADGCDDLCGDFEGCVDDGTGTPGCFARLPESASATCSTCAPHELCVDDGTGTATCRASHEANSCADSCADGQRCVDDAGPGCLPLAPVTDACLGECSEFEICVDAGGEAQCRVHTPYSVLEGLPNGTGLFTSLILHDGVPTLVYYDRLREHLRGAVANFSFDGDVNGGFVYAPLTCDPIFDMGQSASLAVNPIDNSLGVALQGNGGETLYAYFSTGTNLFIGSAELVDTGVRGNRIHLVGEGARIAYDQNGRVFIAYGDQTDNDLLVAYRDHAGWRWVVSDLTGLSSAHEPQGLLVDGAFGSFPRLILQGDQGIVSTFLRARDEFDRDVSRLVVHGINLTLLP